MFDIYWGKQRLKRLELLLMLGDRKSSENGLWLEIALSKSDAEVLFDS